MGIPFPIPHILFCCYVPLFLSGKCDFPNGKSGNFTLVSLKAAAGSNPAAAFSLHNLRINVKKNYSSAAESSLLSTFSSSVDVSSLPSLLSSKEASSSAFSSSSSSSSASKSESWQSKAVVR